MARAAPSAGEPRGPTLTGPPLRESALAGPLTRVFEEAARESPDGVFLRSRDLEGEDRTFAGFLEEAERAARGLIAAGLLPGERLGLLSENRPRWCVAYAAVLLAGGVVVPLDAELSAPALSQMLDDCQARGLFVSAELLERVGRDRPLFCEEGRLLFCLDGPSGAVPGWSELGSEAGTTPLPQIEGGDRPAAIIYTSGTTGAPKGVILTHRNLLAEIEGTRGALRVEPDEVALMFLPLNHVLAQLGSFLLAAAYRAEVVHARIGSGEELLKSVREEGVAILLAVPLLFHLIRDRIVERISAASPPRRWLARAAMLANGALRRTLKWNAGPLLFREVHQRVGPRLRLFVSGGARLDPTAQRDLMRLGFTVAQAWGLTESSGGSTFTPPEAIEIGSVGRPLAGVEIRIDRPDAGGVGEVCLRGPALSPGYHGRERETAATRRGEWFLTGDLGRLSGSELFITGRSKDVIVLPSGKNVHPEEVEGHLASSHLIREICVIGRRSGSEEAEELHAVVVPDWDRLRELGIASAHPEIHDELQRLAQDLPPWLRVGSFQLSRDPLPRTATRKLKRFEVRALAERGDEGDALDEVDPTRHDPREAALLESPEGRRVVDLARRYGRPRRPLRAGSSLELDLGLDSLARAELLLAAESDFDLRLESAEMSAIQTLGDLIEAVRARAGASRKATVEASTWSEVIAAAGPSDLPPWLREGPTPLAGLPARAILALARALSRPLFRPRVRGLEHLPPTGPYLICPNHLSYLDGVLLGAFLPPRARGRLFGLGATIHVQGGLRSRLARLFAIVPTDTARNLLPSMRVAAAGLKRGLILGVFPEGRRSFDGAVGELRRGPAILATELALPLVPCAFAGTFEAWPRTRRWPRPARTSMTFGAPLEPEPAGGDPNGAYERLNERLRQRWIELGALERAGG